MRVTPRFLQTQFPRLRPKIAVTALALSLSACSFLPSDGPVRVAAIGEMHRNPERVAGPLSVPDRLLVDAVGQGLVTMSAEGQVEAGLAERWTVIDEGKSYIFRLRQASWADGSPVRAADVATILRQRIASQKLRPALINEFRHVAQVQAITPRVIEIRLDRPIPELLELLANPDLSFARAGSGWGPLHAKWEGGGVVLTPDSDMLSMLGLSDDDAKTPLALLWGKPQAADAVTQFTEKAADVVVGGRYNDWPLVLAAEPPNSAIVIDPVEGMFGLAAVSDDGPAGEELMRNAISMAIDRQRLSRALRVPEWTIRTTLRPAINGQSAPIFPAWQDFSSGERRMRGAAIVADWHKRHGGAERPVVRIAMPEGSGTRILFAWIRVDLAAIGIDAQRVAMNARADFRLIDEVAPARDPAWYLRRMTCGRGVVCVEETTALVRAIDDTTTPEGRASALATAEEAVIRNATYIPIGSPIRWALRSERARSFKPNSLGYHGLYQLIDTPN